ncbi:hypothetical protein GYMLUDRAFT_64339 [Collybiopsis luxurians FD-317 M1]|uniref:Protein kinase domain-containing protein n=1 Tax=Collybiopsis luxurians FD-317 M1 TaxID=944289 RepID=A0A0D0APT9_9AGAR|nr:hypothetical protein GYMLUDRAFT_64339 [Collybiopsis luxurians FD-317 M1]
MYIVILEEFEHRRLRYLDWFDPPSWEAEETLESIAETLKTRNRLLGDIEFFRLYEPIQLKRLRDMQSACRDLLDYDNLGESGRRCSLKFTLGKLRLAESDDPSQLFEVPQMFHVPLVAVYIPQFTGSNSRHTFPISEDIYAREAIASAAQTRPSPSTGAKSTELTTTQVKERPDAAYNYRPPELAPPPLSIYHPVFARFRREMATPTEGLDFTDKELERASLIIDVSLRHYSNELQRREALRKVFLFYQKSFWQGCSIGINDTHMDPDGALEYFLEFSLPILYTMLGELKNGGGDGGCDPSDQAQCAYIKLISSKQVCFIFLATILRTNLFLLKYDHIQIQCLDFTPYESKYPSRFVHWNSFTFQGNQYDLVYRQRLTSYMEKTVFLAAMSLPSDPNFRETEVVVKFASCYGEAGHRLLAEAGFAPRIYYCGFEESIGLWVIVMDYIQGAVCNRKLIEHEKDSLSSAIAILHKNNLVFGDLREPNVIITEPKGKVYLVDFEWCGPCIDIKEGDSVVQPRVRYPADISMGHGIDWAPGVGRDRVITIEHDIYRLNKM